MFVYSLLFVSVYFLQHDSCPICRLSLNSKPTRGAEGDDSSSSSGQSTLL